MRFSIRIFFIVCLSSLFSLPSIADIQLDKISKKKWLEAHSDNFIVYTDGNKKLGEAIITELEYFRYFISQVLGNEFIQGVPPLEIIAASKTSTFKYLDLPELWAGVFLNVDDDNFAIANLQGYKKGSKSGYGNHVLKHEYVHYAAKKMLTSSYYPIWMREGMAEYLATFYIDKKSTKITVGDMQAMAGRLYSLTNSAGNAYKSVDIEDLFKTREIRLSWRNSGTHNQKRTGQKVVSEFYARSFVTYHYLKSTRELDQQSSTYLYLINSGHTVDDAFSTAFNITYEAMNDNIKSYLSGRKIAVWNYTVKDGQFNFPEVNITFQALSADEIKALLITKLSYLSVYPKSEFFPILEQTAKAIPDNVNLQFRSIAYAKQNQLISSGEANRHWRDLEKRFPGDASIELKNAFDLAWDAQTHFTVGHESAPRIQKNARNAFRKIIREQPANGRAYRGLGMLSAEAYQTNQTLLQEALVSLESNRILNGPNAQLLSSEFELAGLLNNYDQALMLLRSYSVISQDDWVETGYGRFILDALNSQDAASNDEAVSDGSSLRYGNGSKYEGEIKQNKPHGKGTFILYNGSRSTGHWQQGMLEGLGEFISSNGYKYHGEFNRGRIQGYGKLDYPDGHIFAHSEGQFQLGMEHGKHSLTLSSGEVRSGAFWFGKWHGNVVRTLPDGSHQEHQYVLGNPLIDVGDGVIYSGQVNDDFLADAQGVCLHKASNKIFQCEFKNGKKALGLSMSAPR